MLRYASILNTMRRVSFFGKERPYERHWSRVTSKIVVSQHDEAGEGAFC